MNLQALLLGAVVVCASACTDATPPADLAARTVEVIEVAGAGDGSIPVYPGTLRAGQRSDLSFLHSGEVVAVTRELGERFAAGDVLARLDDIAFRLAVDELTANLAEAEANLNDAVRTHRRIQSLGQTGAVSASDVDAAEDRRDAADARVRAIGASLRRALQRLSETELKAPFDGEIAERLVEPAQTVAAGQTVVRITGGDGEMEAVVDLPASALGTFVEGDEASILVLSTGAVRTATVIEVGNSARRSGLYPVTLAVADGTGLRPGLRIEAQGVARARNDASLTIPLTAYLPVSETVGQVFVVEAASGRASVREVGLGTVTDQGIEVLWGLEGGEVIAARGLPWLRDGERVAPIGLGLRQFNE